MTLDKNPRDTAVGTAGDYLNIEREGEQFAIMNFQITTFGDPVEIEVEYTWHPEQTENPEIKTGMVVRIRGWLDDDRNGMLMESWEVAEGPRSERAGMRGPEVQRMACDAASPGPDQPRHHHPRRRRGSRLNGRQIRPGEQYPMSRLSSGVAKVRQISRISAQPADAGRRKTRPGGGIPRRARHPEHGENQPAAGLRGQHHRPPGRSQARGQCPRSGGIETAFTIYLRPLLGKRKQPGMGPSPRHSENGPIPPRPPSAPLPPRPPRDVPPPPNTPGLYPSRRIVPTQDQRLIIVA